VGGAEDRVARVERKLETAEQITHIGSFEWSARTNAVTWSDELYRIYGLEPRASEITLESFLARVHPDDRDRVQGEVRAAIGRGGRFAYEERIVRPDGTVRTLETQGEAARDETGVFLGLHGMCRDVTEERARMRQLRLYEDIVNHVQTGFSIWSMKDANDVGGARLLAYNPASERIARRSFAGTIGKTFLEVVPYAAGGPLEALMRAAADDGQLHQATIDRSSNPDAPTRALTIKVYPLPDHCLGIAIEDVTEQMVERRLQIAEQRVLEMIAEGAPLKSTLEVLVLAIEDRSPPVLASVLLLDPDGARVISGAAPSLPEAYNRAIDGSPIGPRAGSCGTAAFTRRPVFVEDIERDPLWEDYRALARAHGLRACWSLPILATDERVLGTFAFYYREPRAPAADDLALATRATHLARIAIERKQLEEQLRDLSAHVESVREDERTGIAREIHDELGQALTALKMDLAWIGRQTNAPAGLATGALLEKLRAMADMTDDVIDRVRRISAELRPGVLDDLGLSAAIEWQASEFEKRTGLKSQIHSGLGDAQLDRDLSTAVFRIFQEALTNVGRHADASRIDVFLDVEDGSLCLEIRDDGRGISPEAAKSPRSLGLLGIRERARRLGGVATVRRGARGGTVVELVVPMGRSAG
jgi:PAS domain S-box-containing protein